MPAFVSMLAVHELAASLQACYLLVWTRQLLRELFSVTDAKFNVAGGFSTAIRQAVAQKPDAIVLYDGHYAILNGRMARGKGHMKDLLKVTSERKEREREVQMGGKHWWNRNREEEEN